jgi:hypothetical protein
VLGNTTCGATDKQASPGFVNAGAFDLHLATGSAVVNAGDPPSTRARTSTASRGRWAWHPNRSPTKRARPLLKRRSPGC